MIHKRLFFFLLITGIVFSVCAQQRLPEFTIIRNANIIPMTTDTILWHQSIVIREGRILQIIPNELTPEIKGALTIDGSGKFIIPGLMDMHTHFFYEQGDHRNTCEAELKMMLAKGITTARIQCGDSVYLHAKTMVNLGKWKGPQLFVSSPQVVGNWPWKGKVFAAICTTPDEAVKAVTQFKMQGYDEIKITFMVKAAVYDAIIQTASRLNIKVTGHVGPLAGLDKALLAKQQIEHMDEFIEVLLPDTSFNHGMSVSDMGIWRKPNWETVKYLDESKIPALVDKIKEAGIFVTPTNYFFVSCFGEGMSEKRIKAKPDYNFIPSSIKSERWQIRDLYLQRGFSESDRQKYVYLREKMVEELWKAGVPLMAGSDSPEWFLVQGFALHDELIEFVKAGLSPFAALQTATINPATYLQIVDEKGSVQIGKQADFILLNKNPLENIKHTKDIWAVFCNEEYYEDAQINRILKDVAKELSR
jgi:imidazolonepropionase-like amidohydrolase